jgi:hypothetical protein
MQSIQDRAAPAVNGFLVIAVIAAAVWMASSFTLIELIIWLRDLAITTGIGWWPIIVAVLICAGFIASGLTIVQPNEAKVLTFFGKYVGTIKKNGFLATIPFCRKRSVSLRIGNLITDHIKVNDLNGNPIEIGAVVVWRVADAAQASLNIDNYKTFVANQSDIAMRMLAASYPYDAESEASLRGNLDEISKELKASLQDKLVLAGIAVEDARLSHLAYAPEIAAAMLKRQQAKAIFQARQYMVENALAIIDGVIQHFEHRADMTISDDKKVELINSLLVVMTSEKESVPVLNMRSPS